MRLPLLALALAFLSTAAFAENKEVTIKAGGKDAITLSVAKDADVKVKGDKTSIIGKTAQILYLERAQREERGRRRPAGR